MNSLENLWSKVEIRVLVISSLSLQILLLGIAGFRKHVISFRWAEKTGFTWHGPLAHMFHWLLWLAYLLADYVATVALAYLTHGEDTMGTLKGETPHLLMFWAPFFLLHLGGQDTITALSVEDNELWARHLLTLLSQGALAVYNYSSTNKHVGSLWPPAILMFTVGCFKYGERIWSLQRASMSALRSSMITKPDPGPNYAKFMQAYMSSNKAGLTAIIKVEAEKHKDKGDLENQKTKGSAPTKRADPTYQDIVCKAYKFFPTFKRLFVDLILTYKDREESQKYFQVLQTNETYKLIEIELSWMYEIHHSKASVMYSYKYYGWVSRLIKLGITITALVLFAICDHTGYAGFEKKLTYVLLGGAIGLEILALIFMLLSFWEYAVLKEHFGDCCGLLDSLFSLQERLRPWNKSR